MTLPFQVSVVDHSCFSIHTDVLQTGYSTVENDFHSLNCSQFLGTLPDHLGILVWEFWVFPNFSDSFTHRLLVSYRCLISLMENGFYFRGNFILCLFEDASLFVIKYPENNLRLWKFKEKVVVQWINSDYYAHSGGSMERIREVLIFWGYVTLGKRLSSWASSAT